jgi:hypothetical protein
MQGQYSFNPLTGKTMTELFQFAAVLSACFFTAIAIYVSLGEHPARMECGSEVAATVFGPSYRRASKIQAGLALAATISGVVLWLKGAGFMWFIGALFIFTVVPFTLIVIMPINSRLLDPGLDKKAGTTQRLLQEWGRLHAVRSLLGLVSSLIFLILVIWR